MNDLYFPPLDEGAVASVEIILRAVAENPEFLWDDDCPYSQDAIESLQRIAGLQPEGMGFDDDDEEGDQWERLERETRSLYRGLMAEQQSLGSKDNAEKMAFFRTATSLLDKLVGIQERAANLRQIHKFHDTVMTVMEDILEAGQRTEVMERLRTAINPEKSS